MGHKQVAHTRLRAHTRDPLDSNIGPPPRELVGTHRELPEIRVEEHGASGSMVPNARTVVIESQMTSLPDELLGRRV